MTRPMARSPTPATAAALFRSIYQRGPRLLLRLADVGLPRHTAAQSLGIQYDERKNDDSSDSSLILRPVRAET
jgi:hypothetical protein